MPFFSRALPLILSLFLAVTGISFAQGSQSQDPSSALPSVKTEENQKEAELNIRIKQMSDSINDLKEKVYRSKARLKLLEETLLLGKITGSRAIIRFRNNTGGLFRVIEGEYFINGKPVSKVGPPNDQKEEYVVFDGEVPPGTNKLLIKLTFTGGDSGMMKLFSYFKDYKFNLESEYEFPVSYGKTTSLTVEGVDQGPFKNTLEERISVRYKTLTDESTSVPF